MVFHIIQLEHFLKEQAIELEGKSVSSEAAKIYAEKMLKIIPKELPEIAKKMKMIFLLQDYLNSPYYTFI